MNGSFRAVVMTGLLALGASAVRAQEPSPDGRRAEASRQDLQALLDSRSVKLSADERQTISNRLRDGDFLPGDRIRLSVTDEPTLSDSFTVRTGRVLQLPNFPDISLQGVLRSELNTYLTTKIGQFVRNPQVHATSTIRVAVTGPVGKPGFYVVPATTAINDLIMVAGGPSSSADLKKTSVRRNAVPVIDSPQVQQALTDGLTLDQLNMHSGDEVMLREKSGGVKGALQTAGLVSGILLGIFALTRI